MEVARGSRMSAVMPERWVLEGGGVSTAMPEKGDHGWGWMGVGDVCSNARKVGLWMEVDGG